MKLGFVLEQALGHVTHAQNLRRTMADDASNEALYFDIPYHDTPGWQSKLPGVRSNWSVRASLAAYQALRPQAGRLDAALFHTQVTSLFSAGLMQRVPSVVSLDATPLQYDALGALYGHRPSANARLELVKKRLNQRAFCAARHLVTWSEWAKGSLVADYGVDAGKITVIPPGIDLGAWDFPERRKGPGETVNALFVGGDFARKGGDTLLQAFALLPSQARVHLHLVTQTEGVGDHLPNVTVHRHIKPNSDVLRELFRQADMFVLPTRADCSPLVVLEALAAGLPIITTHVGALAETVTDGETGLVVPPHDAPALADALARLAGDSGERRAMGQRARLDARARFGAAQNYGKLVQTVREARA